LELGQAIGVRDEGVTAMRGATERGVGGGLVEEFQEVFRSDVTAFR